MTASYGTAAKALRGVPAPVFVFLLFIFVLGSTAARAQSMAWSPDVAVNQACVKCDSTYSDLKVHSSGNALAIWVQNDGIPDIAVARYDVSAGSWRGFKTLYTGIYREDDRRVMSPRLAMDGRGNAMAVWTESGSNTIYFSRYRASDASWTLPAVLHVGRELGFTSVAVEADPSGNVFVQWTESFGRQIMAKRYNAANGTWSAALPVAYVSSLQTYHMAVDGLGNAIVMWMRNSDFTIHFSRYSKNAGQWSTPQYVDRAREGSGVMLVLDRDGNGTALWSTGPNFYGSLTVSRYNGATNKWSAARIVQTTPGDVLAPDMTVDRAGNVFLVWGQAADYSMPIKAYAARYNNSTGQWSAPQKLTSGTQSDLWFRVAADRNGNAVVVWSQTTRPLGAGDRTFRKASVRYNAATGTWGKVRLSANEVVEAFATGLGIDWTGRAFALYTQDSGYRWNGSIIYGLRANRLTPTQ